MLVIGPQTRLGDVEAGEFEVLLVELKLPHVDGEAGRKTSLRCLQCSSSSTKQIKMSSK